MFAVLLFVCELDGIAVIANALVHLFLIIYKICIDFVSTKINTVC